MPRPERPLAADGGPLTAFAQDLRYLRTDAGGQSYRELARRAHYSVTALSDAAGGKTLPSLAVTLAYVRACDGDPAEWERRWREVFAVLTPAEQASDADQVRPPYLGLSAFRTADTDRFFGRDALLAALSAQVRQRRLVGVLGASGSGKSSLLCAGLAGTDTGPSVVFTPGAHPVEECALRLAAITGESAPVLRREFADDPTTVHLRIRQALADHPAETDLLLVVDQFEELFTLCADPLERQGFIAALAHAATDPRSRARIVLGVRADFFAHCVRHPELRPALGDGQVLVGPMTPDELREAIVKPAAAANCTVDNALVTRLVAETTTQPGVLPLLSHALLETWRRRQGMALTLAGYVEAGGIRHAVARTAETVYTGLDRDRRAVARQILLRLTAPGEGIEDTKRRVPRTELDDSPDVHAVLAAFVAARLITTDRDGVEIAHESLISHWPRLRDWIAKDRAGLRLHRQLTEATDIWEGLGHDPGALYRGARLELAEEWIASDKPGLSRREQWFVDASVVARRHDAITARMHVRRLRRVVALLVAVAVLACGGAGYSLVARLIIVQQRDQATITSVIEQIPLLATKNPPLAGELALAVHRLDPTPQTLGLLLASPANTSVHLTNGSSLPTGSTQLTDVDANLYLDYFSSNNAVQLYRMTPEAMTVASTIPVDSGDTTRKLIPTAPTSAALSPDGTRVAIAEIGTPAAAGVRGAGTPKPADVTRIHVWDVTRPAAPVGLQDFTVDRPADVSFNETGAMLAVGTDTAAVRNESAPYQIDLDTDLYDISKPHAPKVVATLSNSVGSPAFSPDGTEVAGVSVVLPKNSSYFEAPAAAVWNLRDITSGHDTKPRTTAQFAGVPGLVLSSDGQLLAAISVGGDSGGGALTLWKASGAGLTKVAMLPSKATWTAPAFSPQGNLLALVDGSNEVILWDVSDPAAPKEFAELPGDYPGTFLVDFASQGKFVAFEKGDIITRYLDPGVAANLICATVPSSFLTQGAARHTSADWPSWESYFPGMNVPEPCRAGRVVGG